MIINLLKKLDELTKIKSNNNNNNSDIDTSKKIKIITTDSMDKYKNMYPQEVIERNNKRNKIEHQRFLLEEKYNKYLKQHQQYENNIEKFYKLAIYQDNIDNKYTKKCEEQCVLDIELSKILKDYYLKDMELQNEAYNFGINTLPKYTAYIRLAQIYEKRKEYYGAINICNIAIENGYIYESNDKDIFTRKARLEKKHRKNGNIAMIDGNKVNTDTGEIIE